MKYTAAHWGAYQFAPGDADLSPLDGDPAPSRVGKGWVSAAKNPKCRVLAPVVRKGWLAGDKGAARCDDSFIEVSWDKALDLVAEELSRVKSSFGNQAIFGGSYGWSSAGRFHHAQTQMRRFLISIGGYTSSRETYSHAAAEVLYPHIIGMTNPKFQDVMPSHTLVSEHCELMLAFGGIAGRTAQIASAGTSRHEVSPWLDDLQSQGVRVVTIAPERGEGRGDWLPIRPGTDTALILALIYEIESNGKSDADFLARCTTGWEILRAYIMGEADGVPKTPDWAAPICDIGAETIRTLARDLTTHRSMISMAWGMQRADHGEQPIWAGLALACVLGQIGKPGLGYAFGYGSTTPVGRAARLIPWPSFQKGINPISDYIPVARIADMLLSPGTTYRYNCTERTYPDIRLVWWSGGNPFHHHQDLARLEEAWTRPETVIVNEHSWTSTARKADIVLPATTPLERDDIMMNRRDPTLLYMSKMFDPLGQSRDDYDIFTDLAARMGTQDIFTEGRSAADWMAHLWSQAQAVGKTHGFDMPDWDMFRATGRFDVPEAEENRFAFADYVRDPEANPVNSESGKITLFNKKIANADLAGCPGHPTWIPPIEGGDLTGSGKLHLISGQPDTRLHGQNDQGKESLDSKINGREVCSLHPETAGKLGVQEGDIVRLWNTRGACLAAVKLEDAMRRDCVSLPTGAWYDPQMIDGIRTCVHGNPNVLTIDKGCSELSQGNMAHTTVVQIEKWTKPLPPLTVTDPPVIAPAS